MISFKNKENIIKAKLADKSNNSSDMSIEIRCEAIKIPQIEIMKIEKTNEISCWKSTIVIL